MTWDEAEARYLTAMRQYAKRQRTWLRNSYPAAVVFENPNDLAGIVREIIKRYKFM
jgi:tRNA A37 N6-isopentenylltransferase MiaA